MTAIETMRQLYKDRSEPTKWAMGDTVESRAILELADRLDKLDAASKPAATESPPVPFRVEAPGRYRLRNGQSVIVHLVDNESDLHKIGAVVGGWEAEGSKEHTWNRLGHYTGDPDRSEFNIYDLIEGPISAEKEPKRLKGWMNLFVSARPLTPRMVQGAVLYATREEADAQPGAARRIACVEIDVAEGEPVNGVAL